jgi:hypothetical protein
MLDMAKGRTPRGVRGLKLTSTSADVRMQVDRGAADRRLLALKYRLY